MPSSTTKWISSATLALCAPGLLLGAVSSEPLELSEVLRAAAKIDQLLESDLKEKKLQSLPIISEETFVRRTYLNIVGRIPNALEASRFRQ